MMFNEKRLLQYLLVALALVLLVVPAAAQDDSDNIVGDTVTDDEVNEVARDVYCPVCENTPLDVCQTKACADWRELIRTKLAEGQSEQEIFDYFARQYGEGVLANPPRRGVSLIILWVLPVVLILVGLLFFSRYMRGLRSADQPATTAVLSPAGPEMKDQEQTQEPAGDDYMARIEQELHKTDE